jgi:hypothetical protein
MSISTTLAEQVVSAIRIVAGVGPVPLHEQRFNGNEWLYLKKCLDSTLVSLVGIFVGKGSFIKRRAMLGKVCAVGIGLSVRHNQKDIVRFLVNNKL